MSDLLDRVVLPVAHDDDATATARALDGHEFGSALAVHVVEKAGGAPDKASVEQREEAAEEAFSVLRAYFDDEVDLETRILYGTDVADAIFEAADDYGASSIVITPRGGSRWIQLLTGDVALSLVTETDRPVVVLPDVEEETGGSDGE
ncbi:universal stress protein [Halosimplex salinum]|uniref:universal stress protein n=1 Tax=Halosimplex salinum TaxID=1710538 RepID=UPI000F490E0B|nr:universal stress protein [Halosimplex salinum]